MRAGCVGATVSRLYHGSRGPVLWSTVVRGGGHGRDSRVGSEGEVKPQHFGSHTLWLNSWLSSWPEAAARAASGPLSLVSHPPPLTLGPGVRP